MHESLHSLFLAQALGLYLIITAIIMLSRAKYYRTMLTHVKSGSPTVTVAATLGLILGICLVLVHNIWTLHSLVLVTIVAWLILIKSIAWLSFPEFMTNLTHKMYTGAGYYIVAALVGIIGIILLAHGFYLFTVH